MFAEAAAQLIKMTSEVSILHVSVKPAVVEPLVEKRDGKPLHGVGVSPSPTYGVLGVLTLAFFLKIYPVHFGAEICMYGIRNALRM